jgi:hypothetical protein
MSTSPSAQLSSLVQIQPLSQSRFEKMACPHSYVYQEVYGEEQPDNPYSRLGTEVHGILAAYIDHCVNTKKPSDWAELDRLMRGCSEGAAEILNGFRESFTINPKQVVATEWHLQFDEQLKPILPHENRVAMLEGTFDVAQREGERLGRILDFKNYFRIVEPDTFQSKLYPLLWMLLDSTLEAVDFTLVFTRYGAVRSVGYTRADIGRLRTLVMRERERQVDMHTHPEKYEGNTLPGKHCIYCPLLRARRCPLEGRNPYEMSATDRLLWHAYLKQAIKANLEILRDYASRGPITAEDANGKRIIAGEVIKERRSYPLVATLEALEDWNHAEGEDLTPKLNVSSTPFKGYLSAKKRAVLDQRMQDIANVRTYTEFSVLITSDNEEGEE